jgi:small subunit ribosomal protein S12
MLNSIVLQRKKRKTKTKTPKLRKCPQKKGTCLKVFVETPKKPNSALRKVCKVLLTNKSKALVHIPGIGHNLQKHSTVLIRGGRVKDLPGYRYKVIRGKYDAREGLGRFNRRSKYGTKKIWT